MLLVRSRSDPSAVPIDAPRHHRHPRADAYTRPPEFMEAEFTLETLSLALVNAKHSAIRLWCTYATIYLPNSIADALELPSQPTGTATRPVVRVVLGGQAQALRDLSPSLTAQLGGDEPESADAAEEDDADPELQRLERMERELQTELTLLHEIPPSLTFPPLSEDGSDAADAIDLVWEANLAAVRQSAAESTPALFVFDVHDDHREYVHHDIGERDASRIMQTEAGEVSKLRAVSTVGGHVALSSERRRRVRQRTQSGAVADAEAAEEAETDAPVATASASAASATRQRRRRIPAPTSGQGRGGGPGRGGGRGRGGRGRSRRQNNDAVASTDQSPPPRT